MSSVRTGSGGSLLQPSPATYNMLTRAHEKLIKDKGGNAKWHIHNLGLHEVSGQMKWHSACETSVGNELCGVVPDDTADSYGSCGDGG
jgi:hypothetical protein